MAAAAVTSTVGYGASAATASIVSLLQQQARQHHLHSSAAAASAAAAAGVSVLSSTTEDLKKDPFVSGGVIAVIVLGTLCLILGAIYGYIYFTRINPRSNRIRKYMEQANQMDDGAQTTSTHLFLFKKS